MLVKKIKLLEGLILLISVFTLACNPPNPSNQPANISVIPKPTRMQIGEGSFKFSETTKVVVTQEKQQKAAAFLTHMFLKAAGYALENTTAAQGDQVLFKSIEGLVKGAYRLTINPLKIFKIPKKSLQKPKDP